MKMRAGAHTRNSGGETDHDDENRGSDYKNVVGKIRKQMVASKGQGRGVQERKVGRVGS